MPITSAARSTQIMSEDMNAKKAAVYYRRLNIEPKMTFSEAGRILGMSPGEVAEIEFQAIEKIRLRLMANRQYRDVREFLDDSHHENRVAGIN